MLILSEEYGCSSAKTLIELKQKIYYVTKSVNTKLCPFNLL